MEIYEKIEAGIYTLEIVRDENPGDPRDWDNLGTMVCWHPDYALGDYQLRSPDGRGAVDRDHRSITGTISDRHFGTFESLEELEQVLIKDKKAVVVLPLTLYDHSGISLHVAKRGLPFDPGNWDSTFVGFIYTTKERVKELCGDERKFQRTAWLEGELAKEIEVYNQFLSGDVWGYVLRDAASHEVLDATYGFFGSDPKTNGMLSSISDEPRKAIEDALAGKKPRKPLRHFVVHHVEALYVLGTSDQEVRARYAEQGYDVRNVEPITEEVYEQKRKEGQRRA